MILCVCVCVCLCFDIYVIKNDTVAYIKNTNYNNHNNNHKRTEDNI